MDNENQNNNMEDEIDLDVAAAEEHMQQLPILSVENLNELRHKKVIVTEQLREIRLGNTKLQERMIEVNNKVTLMMEKLRQCVASELKLDEKKKLAVMNLANLEDNVAAVDIGLFKNLQQVKGFVENFSIEISQGFMQYKSIECFENGTNTMLYRSEDLKKQIRNLETGVNMYMTKLEQRREQNDH